jgi:tRNA (mo5U34)-methyltransferase
MTSEEILSELKRLEPWFHRIDLGGGLVTKSKSAIGEPVEHPRPTWQKVRACLPDKLSGKTVLDVGCNAGFYSLEMKRLGAQLVLGIDSQRNLIRQAIFVRDVLGINIEYRRMSIYDVDPHDIGQFDITLALGLLYHCKHLVLALEKLFVVTRELLIIETAIYPPERAPASFIYEVGGLKPLLHPLAYVENSSLAKEAIYNWFLPGVEALRALLNNVGFDEVEIFPATQLDRAVFACRKRKPYPDSHAASYLAAVLTLNEGPAHCRPAEVLNFSVLARNTGHARWLREGDSVTDQGAVHLAAHLLSEDEKQFSWYHAGAFLPSEVEPGSSVQLGIAVRAPEIPGRYIVEFDMVAEHITWFEDNGSRTLRHELIVE